MVDDNLYALIITGQASPIDLQNAWNNIQQEYSEHIGNAEYKMYVKLYAEVTALELKYNQVTAAIEILKTVYSKYLCDELNKIMRTTSKFNFKDQASYQEELAKCGRRSKSIKVQLDLKLLQFAAIKDKYEGKEKKALDRAYFTSYLISLSDHAKYQIADTITVMEYCTRIKRYNEYYESLKSKR